MSIEHLLGLYSPTKRTRMNGETSDSTKYKSESKKPVSVSKTIAVNRLPRGYACTDTYSIMVQVEGQ